MVETFAKNIDSYITTLNGSGSVGAVAHGNPSFFYDSTDQQVEGTVAAFQWPFPSGGHSFNQNFWRPNFGNHEAIINSKEAEAQIRRLSLGIVNIALYSQKLVT